MAEKLASKAAAPPLGDDQLLDNRQSPPHSGRMIITLHRAVDGGNCTPSVEFDPVGMFTPGLIDRYIPYLSQQINLAQAAARRRQS